MQKNSLYFVPFITNCFHLNQKLCSSVLPREMIRFTEAKMEDSAWYASPRGLAIQ